MLSSLMGDEWPAEAWSRLEGAQTPEEARAAIDAGAWAVVVGTAITHPTSITSWFKAALEA